MLVVTPVVAHSPTTLNLGVFVKTAVNGRLSMTINSNGTFCKTPVDLIIRDMVMPGMCTKTYGCTIYCGDLCANDACVCPCHPPRESLEEGGD